MVVTQQEFGDFSRFAEQRLSDGAAESLQKLVDDWQACRERQLSVRAIQESRAQHEAGRGLPLREAFQEVRTKLG